MSIQTLATLGGLFALLVFWHFPADWLFQTHKEALAKAKDKWVRFRHCVFYAAMFAPVLALLSIREGHDMLGSTGHFDVNTTNLWYSLFILFASHYVIDSYIPVMLWAKHLRRAPQFADVVPPVTLTKKQFESLMRGEGKIVGHVGWSDKVVDRITYKNDEEAFKAFAGTNIGLLLMIVMDQFFHICFLLPVAWLMMP